MAKPVSFNLDELQKQMLATLPPSDTSVCCCRLVDPSVQAGQHLEDCVLQLMDPSRPRPSSEDFTYASSCSSSPREDQGTAKRRKHRESMARLRQTWRTSIAALQRQEKQLQSELRRAVTSPNNRSENDGIDPLEVLRRAYCELVQEQLRLQDELTELEAERAHKEKYERLLERELDRARTFRAITDGRGSPLDQ